MGSSSDEEDDSDADRWWWWWWWYAWTAATDINKSSRLNGLLVPWVTDGGVPQQFVSLTVGSN